MKTQTRTWPKPKALRNYTAQTPHSVWTLCVYQVAELYMLRRRYIPETDADSEPSLAYSSLGVCDHTVYICVVNCTKVFLIL